MSWKRASWASLQGLTCKHITEPVWHHVLTTWSNDHSGKHRSLHAAHGLPPWLPEQHPTSPQRDACLHSTGLDTVKYDMPAGPPPQPCLAAGEALLAPVRVVLPLPLLEEGTSELVRYGRTVELLLPLPLSPPPLLARAGPTLLLAASVSPIDSLPSLAATEEEARLALLLPLPAPAVALMDQGWSSSRGRSLAALLGPERLEASAKRPVAAGAPADAHKSVSEQAQQEGLSVQARAA